MSTTRFNPEGHRWFDTDGTLLAGGKIRFKEPSSDTLKDTYSDDTLTTPNTNPVVLDGNGLLQTDVWLDGTYKVEILDADDVELEEIDPVGSDAADGPWANWASATSYSIGDIAKGSDGNYYQSITNSNAGNDPTSSAANWSQVDVIKIWNTNETYDEDDVVKYDGVLYKSVQGTNSANTPGVTPLYWVPAVLAPVTKILTITSGDAGNTVSVTGVGFRARLIHFNAVPSNGTWEASSFAYSIFGGATECIYRRNDGTNVFGGTTSGKALFLTNNGATQEVAADVNSIIADGVTLDVSAGTNTTGYLTVTFYP